MKSIAAVLVLLLVFSASAGELQEAAARGDLDRVRALVKAAPASVNARDRGTTALHEAARGGHLKVVEFLVASGANLNVADISGSTPLRLAMGYQRTAVAEFLRRHAALEKVPAPTAPTAPAAAAVPRTASIPPAMAPRDSHAAPPPPRAPATATQRAESPQVAPARSVTNAIAAPTNQVSERDMLPVIYPIHEAARLGDVEQVKFLFKTFPDLINSTDQKALTPLHIAAANRQTNVARVLLSFRAEINPRSDSGQTPLHLAARHGDISFVELLLANRAEVNARDNLENTPLLLAVQGGQDEALQATVLVGERFGRDVSDKRAAVAKLHQQQLALTTLLLTHGADVNARNRAGSSALLHSVRLGNEAVVRALLAAGANPNVEDAIGGTAPLHIAAGRGQLPVVQALLAGKAAVNAPDARGETPLCYALREGRADVAAALKKHGAIIGKVRPFTATEQSLIAFYQQSEAALQKAGASEKARIILAMTPTKAEVARMFPQHAAAAWKVVDQLNREVKQSFQKPVTDAEQGREIWRVRPEPPSLLAQDWRDRGWIARDLPVLSLVVDKVGATSRPGDYCFVNQRWVLLPPLRAIAAQQQAAVGK